MIRIATIILTLIFIIAIAFLAFSHRILPVGNDPCQSDVSHLNHVAELPPFHCIGHSEGDAVHGWDHVHPWMTREWYVANGLPFNGDTASDNERNGDEETSVSDE